MEKGRENPIMKWTIGGRARRAFIHTGISIWPDGSQDSSYPCKGYPLRKDQLDWLGGWWGGPHVPPRLDFSSRSLSSGYPWCSHIGEFLTTVRSDRNARMNESTSESTIHRPFHVWILLLCCLVLKSLKPLLKCRIKCGPMVEGDSLDLVESMPPWF